MLKKIASLIFTLLLLGSLLTVAYAHDIPDSNASGSITVHLASGNQIVDSGALYFYRVGEIVEQDGNYGFRLTEAFAASGETLQDLQTPETAARLAAYAQRNERSGIEVPIENGTALLEVPKGQLGLYLVTQQQLSEGWQAIEPFLISVPGVEEGSYIYQVDASPKVGPLLPDHTPQPPAPEPIGPTLPQTGQLDWPIPVLTIAGLGLFAAGWFLRFYGKKSDHEA